MAERWRRPPIAGSIGPQRPRSADARRRRRRSAAAATPARWAACARARRRRSSERIPRADLDERDPDYIREQLPLLWLLSSIWFRGEVRGLGNIPDDGSGAARRQPLGRQHDPGHDGVHGRVQHLLRGRARASTSSRTTWCCRCPTLGWLRKFGTVAASPDNARKALDSGAALLVYPGGDYEVHRPSWQRNRVDFGGRKGFIRLALEQDVPIVPVVSIGGQETALFLTRGERLARLLALDRLCAPEGAADLAGASVGPEHRRLLGHIPLPAKITIETLPAIDLRERVRPRPRRRRGLRPPDAPDAGHARRARRRAALAGDRMRVAPSIEIVGARSTACGTSSPTPSACSASCRA